jgi:hypothetical protein
VENSSAQSTSEGACKRCKTGLVVLCWDDTSAGPLLAYKCINCGYRSTPSSNPQTKESVQQRSKGKNRTVSLSCRHKRWKLNQRVPSPDSIFNLWAVCSNYSQHVGGHCAHCNNFSPTIWCKKCEVKTRPVAVVCKECDRHPRTFRVLAETVRMGKSFTDWTDELPAHLRELYETQRSSSVHMVRNEEPDEGNPPRVRLATPKYYFTPEQRKRIPRPDNDRSFYDWLLLAWCVRQADHALILNPPRELGKERLRQLEELTRIIASLEEKGLSSEIILDLTYIPLELFESGSPEPTYMLLRDSIQESRKYDSDELRAYRQEYGSVRDARDDRTLEQLLFSRLGTDKQTSDISKQIIWTWIFVPLVITLLPYARRRKTAGYVNGEWGEEKPLVPDEAFKTASRLIHLRYPHIWLDNWQRVKARCIDCQVPLQSRP